VRRGCPCTRQRAARRALCRRTRPRCAVLWVDRHDVPIADGGGMSWNAGELVTTTVALHVLVVPELGSNSRPQQVNQASYVPNCWYGIVCSRCKGFPWIHCTPMCTSFHQGKSPRIGGMPDTQSAWSTPLQWSNSNGSGAATTPQVVHIDYPRRCAPNTFQTTDCSVYWMMPFVGDICDNVAPFRGVRLLGANGRGGCSLTPGPQCQAHATDGSLLVA
jgi:hypothetical protein